MHGQLLTVNPVGPSSSARMIVVVETVKTAAIFIMHTVSTVWVTRPSESPCGSGCRRRG